MIFQNIVFQKVYNIIKGTCHSDILSDKSNKVGLLNLNEQLEFDQELLIQVEEVLFALELATAGDATTQLVM